MSWNRTVTCSNCYSRGHNKRGCPDLKAAQKADPNCYNAIKPKKCSFCTTTGHNRRTCLDLKTKRAQAITDCRRWRTDFAAKVVELNIGKGTLINVPNAINEWDETLSRYVYRDVMATVVDFEWGIGWGGRYMTHEASKLNRPSPSPIIVRYTNNIGMKRSVEFPIIEDDSYLSGKLVCGMGGQDGTKIVSPMGSPFVPPPDWVDRSGEAIEHLFNI